MPPVAMIVCQQILNVTNIWLELYFYKVLNVISGLSDFFLLIHLTNIQYLHM